MNSIAIIPARGGSKGLLNKNIKLLNDIPLIAYTIEAAQKATIFDRIIVSTDDEKIAQIALKYHAEVPFMRPKEISGDTISSDDVIEHALRLLESEGECYKYVCKLQPTSPMRNERHIAEAYEEMLERNAESVVSVCECEHSPLWSGSLDNSLSMKNFMQDNLKTSLRQELPKYYRLNGAIYWSKVEAFKKNKNFLGENAVAYIMQKEYSVDIDDILDFQFAEYLLQNRSKNEV